MAATTPSAALVPVTPVFTSTERPAVAGFLAGYSGLTREACELDLRQYASWCLRHQLRLFAARRADIEWAAGPGPHAGFWLGGRLEIGSWQRAMSAGAVR